MKHALRSLFRTPGFTSIAIVTLALGIGLNTAMFSIVNTLILRPLPFPESERLFRALRTTSEQRDGGHSPANAIDLQRDAADFAEVAIYRFWGYTLAQKGKPAESFTGFRISPNFFETLGVPLALGRNFRPEENALGQNRVAIISHYLWTSRFNSDPAIVGQVIRLDGEPIEVVGVASPTLATSMLFGFVHLFRPLGLNNEEAASRTDLSFNVVARPHPGVLRAQAETRFAALAARLVQDHPKENADTGVALVPLAATRLDGAGRQITFMLIGLSGFVLLIACANLANLLLARAVARAREFAIRAALGASRTQLIRPLSTECVLLALAGGAGGMFVAHWTMSWMGRRFSDGDGPGLEFALDWRIITFALAASFLTALLFGVAPAWVVSRVRVNETLKSGTRGSTGDRSQHRFRQTLIVGQFALALVLLTGAAFFVRGLDRLLNLRSGWDPVPLVGTKISLPGSRTTDPDKMLAFHEELRSGLAALPGVANAAVSLDIPTFGFTSPRPYIVSGREPPPAGREPRAATNAISPEYLDVVGTRLRQGRNFTTADSRTSAPVVLISESMARALFPNGDAVGQSLARADEKTPVWAQIVGVVEDVEFINLGPAQTPYQLYKPLAQETWGWVAVTLRAREPAAVGSFVEPFRRVVASLDPDMPVNGLAPIPQSIERNISDLHVINELLIAFALLGLFLAAIGIYGVIARLVLQRTNEIGIRMALGAQLADVVRLILGAGLRMAALGTVVGLLGAFGLTRFLTSQMPGLATSNTVALAAATAVLVAVGLVACWLPARRATKVNPLEALRAE